jgi:hypothetical protein
MINIPKYEFRTDFNHRYCLQPIYKNQQVIEYNNGGEEYKGIFKYLTNDSIELTAKGDVCSVPVFKHFELSEEVKKYFDKNNLPQLEAYYFDVYIGNGMLKSLPKNEVKYKKFNTDELIDEIYLKEIKKFYIIVHNDGLKGMIYLPFEDLFLINLWEPKEKYFVMDEYDNGVKWIEYVIYYFEL